MYIYTYIRMCILASASNFFHNRLNRRQLPHQQLPAALSEHRAPVNFRRVCRRRVDGKCNRISIE